ncbi:MAG: hypothetical protein OXF41_06020 [bacterium]|nr:hypothetical protein [Acidimicrobiia bacterium]MCY4368973.1 hypothetical protein [bacterium]
MNNNDDWLDEWLGDSHFLYVIREVRDQLQQAQTRYDKVLEDVLRTCESIRVVARAAGIPPSTLRGWIAKDRNLPRSQRRFPNVDKPFAAD